MTMLITIPVHILCDIAPDEEDLKTAKQLADLGLPVPVEDENKPLHEWRAGHLVISSVEAYYPAGKYPQHTTVQMASGNRILVQQDTATVTELIEQAKIQEDGKRSYNYSTTLSGV